MQGDGSGAIHAAETSACLLDACVRVSICHAAWRAPCAAMHSHMHTHYHHRSIHKWQQTSTTTHHSATHNTIHALAQRTHRLAVPMHPQASRPDASKATYDTTHKPSVS